MDHNHRASRSQSKNIGIYKKTKNLQEFALFGRNNDFIIFFDCKQTLIAFLTSKHYEQMAVTFLFHINDLLGKINL